MSTEYLQESEVNFLKISELFEEGKIIAFPTETVYGLGCSVSCEDAIKRLRQIKKREEKKPFPILLPKIEDVYKVAEDIPDIFFKIADFFFPGPLTVILKKKKGISSLISLTDTIGVRISAHPFFLKIANFLKEPIIGTSANISNCSNNINGQEVLKTFNNQIDVVIEGGRSPLGIPSTVISLVERSNLAKDESGCKGAKILRDGFIQKAQLENFL